MIDRSPQRRADSMFGFYERMQQDIDRDRNRRSEYLKNARNAHTREDFDRVHDWLGYARMTHRRILQKLKQLASVKLQADKLQSAADLERSRERQEAAE
ncbi:hypothetical protein IWQ49_006415 [Labrenzia sp. EL_126]|nr:hypothetical protein [Labrenzia sp. EL_126]